MSSTKWFDENGNEIVRKYPNNDELEYIGEIGGAFEEFSVGLNFYSENLDKHEISKLVGSQPTKSWNPGEIHPIGNSNKTRITGWGKWYLSSIRDRTDLNVKLKELLLGLTTDLENWKILTSKYQAWIDVVGYMGNWNRAFTLEPEVMKILSDRNLEVVFDIYYNGESENED